jgi:hypothetical protein
MARPAWRHASNTSVAQVWKGTIGTTTNDHTYTVTITDDNGDTAAITYTVVNPPDTTTTLVATGFITAWNASLNPLVSKFTASQSSGQVILTADTAGRPFAFSTSGTGTWSGTGNTTNAVSNNDYGQATNWSTDAVPTTSDDVVLGDGTVAVKYGLNQSSVTIDEFNVSSGWTGDIGRWEDGKLHYLRIDPDSFNYNGRSQFAAFDLGSANIAATIQGSGTPSTTGGNSVYIKGSNLTTLTVNSGNVGVANADNDTATVATIRVNQLVGVTAPTVVVGAGTTLTTLSASAGSITQKCASTTTTIGADATLTTQGTGAIATVNCYGTGYFNSTGTITDLYAYGTVDFSQSTASRTVTNLRPQPGCTIILAAGVTVTNIIQPTNPGTYTIRVAT